MTNPNPPAGEPSPFDKPAADPTDGQPQFGQPQFGQPQYGQPAYGQPSYGQPGPTSEYGAPPQPPGTPYLPVTPGYYPVFDADGRQVLVPLASPGKRIAVALLEILLYIITLGIGYFIWLLIAWGRGQTPGKQIAKLKYVDVSTGRVATWGKSALRDFVIRGIVFEFIFVFTLTIGWFVGAFMIFSKEKNYQAGWDRMSGTVVVDTSNVFIG